VWVIIAYFVDTHVVTFIIILALSYISCFALAVIESNSKVFLLANDLFFSILPYAAIGVLAWFIVAYFYNADMIDKATGAYALERRENKRVYNLVENLCISCGMEMPGIHIIDSSALNAFASGVSSRSYTITLTRGIINGLKDNELEGVIAHELTHIRNNDVRVLMVSIVFVGIFDLLIELSIASLSGRRRKNVGKNRFLRSLEEEEDFLRTLEENEEKEDKKDFLSNRAREENRIREWRIREDMRIREEMRTEEEEEYRTRKRGGSISPAILIVLILAPIGYGISILMSFAISRNREYMADAGAAELTRDPKSLASALRKISRNSILLEMQNEEKQNEMIAQLFIEHKSEEGFFAALYKTHPSIGHRIALLEQF
jgi:Zn-dependent protease with chaperone function